MFVFKMSVMGPRSGVHLVKQMQPRGDLENMWIMFDHIKHVTLWITMVYHIYDSIYCQVMTIAICNMQSKDDAAQMILWKNLNDVTAGHSIPKPKFKEFIADSV